MERKRKTTNSEAETLAAGEELARTLCGGEVILLSGELGAGKTVFARGLARGLGVKEPVTSPTFTLMTVYTSGRLTFCHFDAYRLPTPDEVFTLGLTDYLGAENTVSLIEWPDKAGDIFPNSSIRITMRKISESSREIEGL